jgi:Fic-DOC domain mobile mystery protein B
MMDFDYPEGATPLSRDEADGLLLTHITTRDELNLWEQKNITEAIEWLDHTKPKDVLNEAFARKLHEKMFGGVWNWAGTFRQREVTIGRPWERIPEELKQLFDDVRGWMEHRSYSDDEIGVRFHHRLTLIHPFPNGNGRHARLMADLLAENVLGRPRFTWGGVDLTMKSNSRSRYIQALHTADNEFNYGPLLEFARS